MDLKQIVILAMQVSILATVFGFGLKTRSGDLLYLLRRPSLLARSLLSVFVIMPMVAVGLTSLFNFHRLVEIALVALAISPVPPILPGKEGKAGGHASYGIGLMAILALLALAAVPLAMALLGRLFGREFGMAAGTIAGIVLKSTLLPLAAGIIVRAVAPAIGDRLERPVTLVGKVLLPVAALVLVAGALPAMWALVGNGSVLPIVLFTAIGLAVGHVLGGPNPDESVVLALSTASRHPAIAFAIAAANFPEERFGATILLYLLTSALVCVPYLAWQRRPAARAAARMA
jgi:BASS family bile acid:Na+ symporter